MLCRKLKSYLKLEEKFQRKIKYHITQGLKIHNYLPTFVIGLYILIDLEIRTVFINPSKIYKILNSFGLVFTNLEVFIRI